MRGEVLVPLLIVFFWIGPSYTIYRRVRGLPNGVELLRGRRYRFWMTAFATIAITTAIMLPSVGATISTPPGALVVLSVLAVVATSVAGYGMTRLLALTLES